MSQVTPPPIDPAPAVPIRGTPTFKSAVDAFLTWMALIVTQFQAVATNVYNNALDCYNNAVSALASKNAAAQSETNAANTATAITASATALAGAPAWVSGRTYAAGDPVYSLINFKSFRRRTSGAGTDDPASTAGAAVWAPLGAGGIRKYVGGIDPDSYNAFVATSAPVVLPDLTTVSNSFGLCALSNSQAAPASVTTSDGWSVATGFAAGTLKMISPTVTLTPHGIWGSAAMTPPINSSQASGSVAGVNPVLCSVAISATLHVAVFYDTANAYFVAYDPTTGLSGGVATLALGSISAPFASIYATSSTDFVAFLPGSPATAIAGSVSGLAIALGSARTIGSNFSDTPLRLSAGTYLMQLNAANDLQVLTASGNSTAVGTAVASGAASNGAQNVIAPVSATTALVAFPTAATGPTTVSFRVATITGTAIALGTPATTATSICKGSNTGSSNALFPLAIGGPYLYCGADNTTAGTGNFYGVTVSGTSVSVGAVTSKASLGWFGTYRRSTFSTESTAFTSGQTAKAVDATRCVLLFGGNLYAVSFSGTTLAFGAAFALAGAAAFLSDVATGANIYAVGSSTYSKLSVTGTTIAAAYTIGVVPTIVYSDTLSDKAVSYAGTWYSWSGLPAAALAVSASKYLSTYSWPTINIYGSFS